MNSSFFKSFYSEGVFVIPEKELVVTDVVEVTNPQPLIEQSNTSRIEETIDETPIPFIGQNKRKIVILVEDPDDDFINEKDKDFLSKILAAVRLTFNDVALINTFKNAHLSINQIEDQLEIKILLVFGKGTPDLGNNHFIKYKTGRLREIEILSADLLSEIQEDKEKKIKLWEELKKLFS